MKTLLMPLCVAAWTIGCFLPVSAFSASAHSTMRMISLTAKPTTVSRKGIIAFTVRVEGIQLDFQHTGKPPVAGHGHLQYYLDRIPSDAYRKADLRHPFLGAVSTPIYIFSVRTSPVKISPGKHRILVALAQNNYVLYHSPIKAVTITVT